MDMGYRFSMGMGMSLPYDYLSCDNTCVEHPRTFAGYYQDDVWAFGFFADMQTEEVGG